MSAYRSPALHSKAERLKRAVRPLKPIRPPFYVQHATPDCLLPGWYWQPLGCPIPVPLGSSYDSCIITIDRLTRSLETTQPQATPA